ncbi:MAG TPA: hypothetical protein PKD50_03075 [Leptospiraceae bacterium]|nr:hypothetical protein [Leptospiraceae bacterium]
MATDTKPKKESFRKMTTVHQTPREWESVETNIDKMLEYVSQNNLLKDPYIKLYNGKPILTVRPGSSKNSFILEVSNRSKSILN